MVSTMELTQQAIGSLETIRLTRVSPRMIEAARVTVLNGQSVAVSFAYAIRVDEEDVAHVRALGTHGARILRTMETALRCVDIKECDFWNEVTKMKTKYINGLQAILVCKTVEGDGQSTPRLKNHLKII